MEKQNRVGFFNKALFHRYVNKTMPWLSAISVIWGLVSSYIPRIFATVTLLFILFVFCVIYFVMWENAKNQFEAHLEIHNSPVDIMFGDFFSEKIYNNHDCIKVFSFNEYFDTLVDEKVISSKSLNGQFINNKVNSIRSLDEKINSDRNLNEQKAELINNREEGKKQKYHLGSIFQYADDIFLTALSKFDKDNKARLSTQEYLEFLVNFWDQVDKFYAQKTVVIPLFGAGITRLDNNIYTDEDLLRIIIWSFALRRIKFSYPAKLIILLGNHEKGRINLFDIEETIKNGLP